VIVLFDGVKSVGDFGNWLEISVPVFLIEFGQVGRATPKPALERYVPKMGSH